MTKRGKTAIIMMGGAMRSSHGGGFLWALGTKLGITAPDIMIASSGDAGNMLYYIAGQYQASRRVWVDLLTNREFISRKRFWKMMDVDYLIDVIFKKIEPLDVDRVMSSSTKWFIPVCDFDTGRTRYISARDKLDVYEVLRAAKAVPIFYGKKIPLAHHRYIDGEYGPTEEDHVRFAIAQGAEKIVIVRHTRPWSFKSKLYARMYMIFGRTPRKLDEAIRHDMADDTPYVDMPGVDIMLVRPQWMPLTSVADNNRGHIRANFERGVHDAFAFRKQLEEMFASPSPVLYSAHSPRATRTRRAASKAPKAAKKKDELSGAQEGTTQLRNPRRVRGGPRVARTRSKVAASGDGQA